MPRDASDIHSRWERALERRGPDAVRLLLRISAGHDADMAFHGLMPEPPDPPRNFVENWLASKEASGGRMGQKLIWPVLLLIVAGGLVWAWVTFGGVELPQGLPWPL